MEFGGSKLDFHAVHRTEHSNKIKLWWTNSQGNTETIGVDVNAGISCLLSVFQSQPFWTLQRSYLGILVFGKKTSLPLWMIILSRCANLSHPWQPPWKDSSRCKVYSVNTEILNMLNEATYISTGWIAQQFDFFQLLAFSLHPPPSSEPAAQLATLCYTGIALSFCTVQLGSVSLTVPWFFLTTQTLLFGWLICLSVCHVFASSDVIWINKMSLNDMAMMLRTGAVSWVSCLSLLPLGLKGNSNTRVLSGLFESTNLFWIYQTPKCWSRPSLKDSKIIKLIHSDT